MPLRLSSAGTSGRNGDLADSVRWLNLHAAYVADLKALPAVGETHHAHRGLKWASGNVSA